MLRLLILVTLLSTTVLLSSETESSPGWDGLEEAIDRYVVGMERIAKTLLADTGMEQSEIDRVAANFSAKLRSCIAKSFEEEAETSAAESNEAQEACVNEAFENAGITSPF